MERIHVINLKKYIEVINFLKLEKKKVSIYTEWHKTVCEDCGSYSHKKGDENCNSKEIYNSIEIEELIKNSDFSKTL